MSDILITGGSGSLGTAICENLLSRKYSLGKIIVYSRSEHLQEQLHERLADKFDTSSMRYLVGDIRDIRRLKLVFKGNNITHVINAAALKIVPKGEYDPIEFVKTNVYGVQNVIEATMGMPYARVLQVSTDKAVYPINLYGATKLCAEKLILAANNLAGRNDCAYGFARYGNVSGSKGSVIPLFKRQIASDKYITVTHKDMTRFYISLKDAAKFVISAVYGLEKESRVFIPRMDAYKILTLVAAMQGNKVDIKYTGIRPGEKLHESILTPEEATMFPTIPIASNKAKFMSARTLRLRLKEDGLL